MNIRSRNLLKAYHRLFVYFRKIRRTDKMISITFKAYGAIAAKGMKRQLKRLEVQNSLKYHKYEKELEQQ